MKLRLQTFIFTKNSFDTLKMKKLTKAQKAKLAEHKKHHSVKHMAQMRRDLRAGMSFSKAHAKAQKMVGK